MTSSVRKGKFWLLLSQSSHVLCLRTCLLTICCLFFTLFIFFRLEKNREAASQSRARKKSYVKELEVKCRMLEAHVAQLQRVMTVTSMENSALKDELVRVKKPKDGVKTGVAEPAVLESSKCFSPSCLTVLLLNYNMWTEPSSSHIALFGAFYVFCE